MAGIVVNALCHVKKWITSLREKFDCEYLPLKKENMWLNVAFFAA
jgi:hypothetical protein